MLLNALKALSILLFAATVARAFPDKLSGKGQAKSGPYVPQLSAVFIHRAGDSRDGGSIPVYSFRGSPR